MSLPNPYDGLSEDQWLPKTEELLAGHPLKADQLIDVVLSQWNAILGSTIGGKLQIGKDVFPIPQIMGSYLHELIPAELQRRDESLWRRDTASDEKDLVCLADPFYSTEIKTSSHKTQIFGNRSYAQPPSATSKKSKSGFYITVNFERWIDVVDRPPAIRQIRFGWLDHTDWKAQNAETGQQARVLQPAYKGKLPVLYPVSS